MDTKSPLEKILSPAERRRSIAVDHQRRSVRLIRDGETDRSDGPMTNDPAVYVDADWARVERKAIFTEMPLLAGFGVDIPEAGDKLLFEATGVPILVVRAGDGRVNAFLNMCTHRAAKLVTECTRSKKMTCRFHAWTFDLEGMLTGMPAKESFAGIAKADRGLIRVPVVEWAGMIFVKPRPGDDEIDIEAFLADFAPEVAQLEFERMRLVKATRLEIDANWKYALDTYGEAYHFNSLHPSSIGSTHYTDRMCYDDFNPHHRIAYPYKHVGAYIGRSESEWPDEPFNAVHLLFPNVILNVWQIDAGPAYSIYRLFPGETPDKAFALTATYRPDTADPDVDDQPWIDLHDYIEEVVTTEDYSVSADGQRNLAHAPADFRVVYGSNEIAIQNFHRRLAAYIDAERAR
ncbi:aromatic ring-hydroxylating oxygenase subunit alpha [Croceicoccus ponticola]|nr:SRPBCC family protein [Croceicoccus ponticola]